MEANPILGPAAVLVLWSLFVLLWMTATRLAAFSKAGVKLAELPAGGRYADIEAEMPANVNWVSHNYTHLMEQPTIFYAAVVVLAVAGDASALNLGLAWGYAGLRIAHSLWQGMSNVIMIRLSLFTLSTFCLWGLAINAVWITVF
ncbi:MAG: MAPEG family protein [Pseudomonadota bacterium]